MNTRLELSTLTTLLHDRFGGVILSGFHQPGGQCCALELLNVARGNPWSDDPVRAGVPDIRSLNDAAWPDSARTAAMLPLLAALSDWTEWGDARRMAWARSVVLRTVRELLPLALLRWPHHAQACREARDLPAAAAAARAAAAYAAAALPASRITVQNRSRAAAHAEAAAAAAAYAAAHAEAAAAAAAYAAADAAYAAADAAYAAADAAYAAADAAAAILELACRIWTEEAERGRTD
jgi:hypothetical protein